MHVKRKHSQEENQVQSEQTSSTSNMLPELRPPPFVTFKILNAEGNLYLLSSNSTTFSVSRLNVVNDSVSIGEMKTQTLNLNCEGIDSFGSDMVIFGKNNCFFSSIFDIGSMGKILIFIISKIKKYTGLNKHRHRATCAYAYACIFRQPCEA